MNEQKAQAHNINGLECWCRPIYETVCPECDGDGCPICGDGWITLNYPPPDVPVVVIHSWDMKDEGATGCTTYTGG